MRYEVLGPVRASRDDGTLLNLGSCQRRAVFAVLLLHANQPLSREQFIDAIWGPACPTYAANLLQKQISGLRRQLEPTRPNHTRSEMLVWTDSGYLLTVPDGDLDLQAYDAEVASGRAARARGDWRKAAEVLHRALTRWRGQAFDGLSTPLLDAQRHRLAEQRIDIVEERIELDLALGAEHDLVVELRELVADHPFRDRLSELLMLTLYRTGRQADALAVFHSLRRYLRDELGIDPSTRMQTLHQRILTGDPTLDRPRVTWPQEVPPVNVDLRSGRAGVERNQTRSISTPHRIDVSVPHPSRVHDYWLGGRHNFAADRELAEEIIQIMPGIEEVARLNQAFLRRATLFMVESGIRQFIDLGSGIPTVRHLHDIVQRADPECRIVYVDPDPVAVAHSALLFEPNKGTAVIQMDLRDVTSVLDSEVTRPLLDLERPIGLIAPMLHFIPDRWNPAAIIASYRDRLVSGSYLALAHVAADAQISGLPEVIKAYKRTDYHVHPRSCAEIMRMCNGFDLVWPGLVEYAQWRPERPGDVSADPGINSLLYGAVGRKP